MYEFEPVTTSLSAHYGLRSVSPNMAEEAPKITLRPPSHTTQTNDGSVLEPPPLDWIKGTWHVTHSTLPMWKSKHNVRITYTPLPSTRPNDTPQIDDLVEYENTPGGKTKSVHGVDTPSVAPNGTSALAYDWRGKGLLKIAGSHWEILGYGEEANGNAWIVTCFAKTLFTPQGIDVYSRKSEGLQEQTMDSIKAAMKEIGDADFKSLAGTIFRCGSG